ncbi:nitrite reductase small subunit NirD [Paenibacillus turpanensis]|uniref:nitrite reductase small subunit NirD n=1 Tax=Paenibacillus turpanensis TaxID=2689078 RepID=UPI001FB5CB6A|nr:nitrite reductase small subunit NirD [Paenibacillus turpanensis]
MLQMTPFEQLQYIEVGASEQFPPRAGRQVIIGDYNLAMFRTTDGALYALENRTPHKKGGPLTEGIVSGGYVYCPLRDLKIELSTGLVQAPDTGEVRTYPVIEEAGIVKVGIPF